MPRKVFAISNNEVSFKMDNLNDDIIKIYEDEIDASLRCYADGITDNFEILQNIINKNTGTKIILGTKQTDVYIISQPLILNSGSYFVLNGTLKIQNGITRYLTSNVNAGSKTINCNSSGFEIGQWFVIVDDNRPITGGGSGARTTRSGEGRKITGKTANSISFDTPLIYNYTVAAHVSIGHSQNCIICKDLTNVTIEGNGIIDNNRTNQDTNEPVRNLGFFEPLMGACITFETCTGVTLKNITGINGTQHNFINGYSTKIDYLNITSLNTFDKNILFYGCQYGKINKIYVDGSIHEDGVILYMANKDLIFNDVIVSNCPRYGFSINSTNDRIIVNNLNSSSHIAISNSKNCILTNIFLSGVNKFLNFSNSVNCILNNFIADNDNAGITNLLTILGAVKNLKLSNIHILNTDTQGSNGCGIYMGISGGNSPDNVIIQGAILYKLKLAQTVELTCTNIYWYNSHFTDCISVGVAGVSNFVNCVGNP